VETSVVDNPEYGRYELRLDGEVAGVANYREENGRLVFFHTEVDPEFAGQGLGGQLARGVLEAMRERGEQIVPVCPFIAGYIGEHREYADVVVPEMRRRFEPQA
jgi:predicted GNAT family acetyltransferase